jgi:plastocyanin
VTVRRSVGALAAAGALALVAAPGAWAATQAVTVQFAAFSPTPLDVLPGETVVWTNMSERTHTVTSDAGAFASGSLLPGSRFSWTFTAVGPFPYHCTIHPGMIGEVDVRHVTLTSLPPAAVPAGTRVEMSGRTADPAVPVRVERSLDGTHFAAVATATPTAAGDWSATVPARATADYRAVSDAGVSEVRRLLVSDRHVRVRARHGRVSVTVTPSDPTAVVVLQERLRDRFGWWPVARRHLDYVSTASFRVRRHPVRARVVLVDEDGWTPLAISRVLKIMR